MRKTGFNRKISQKLKKINCVYQKYALQMINIVDILKCLQMGASIL